MLLVSNAPLFLMFFQTETQRRLIEVVYHPNEKKLYLIFEFFEQDFKKYLNQNKHTMTQYQIKVLVSQSGEEGLS